MINLDKGIQFIVFLMRESTFTIYFEKFLQALLCFIGDLEFQYLINRWLTA